MLSYLRNTHQINENMICDTFNWFPGDSNLGLPMQHADADSVR